MTFHDPLPSMQDLAFPRSADARLAEIQARGGDKTDGVVPAQGQGRKIAQRAGNSDTGAIRKMQALGRLKTGQMNKTEAAYAQHLEIRKVAGEILWYRFEGVKLRLADNTFLTVDFAVMRSDGLLTMIDVKGSKAIYMDDAKVKMKVAADTYPFVFKVAFPRPKREGGGWIEEDV